MKCYFFISKYFEKIDCNDILGLKSELDLFGLPKENTLPIGSTCIDILNNIDKIICILNHCRELTDNPFYTLTDYLSTELAKINKSIADVIVYELDNYFFEEINKIQESQNNVKSIRKSLSEYESFLKDDDLYDEYYDNLIKDFQNDSDDYDMEMLKDLEEEKNDKTEGRKEISNMIETTKIELKYALEAERNYKELPHLIKNYIQKVIESITNYKYYFDLYFGISDYNFFNGKNLDYFQAIFGLEIEVPKFYIYNSFEDNNYIYPLKNLFFKLTEKEKEKSKVLKGETVKTLKNLSLDITRNLSTNNKIIHCKLYEIKTLKDILNIYLNFFVENNIIINQCKNCANYFIPSSRTDEKYCNNPSPQNPIKTCKEYGAKKTYRDEIKSTPIKYEHNKISQFYRMRIKRAKNQKEKTKYENIFNTYKENYQKNKIKYKLGKLNESDFLEWIKNQRTTQK